MSAKRLHDHGYSGWWTLVILVPLVGALWFLALTGFMRGDVGRNRYGPPPA